jgi:hypothetical protein
LVEVIIVSASTMYFLSGSVRGGNCSGSFRGNVITVMLSRFSVEEELSLDKFDNSEELEELEELFGVFRLFFQLWTEVFFSYSLQSHEDRKYHLYLSIS